MMMQSIEIREMTKADIDQVLDVEAASFQKPWTREAFENEITMNQFAHYFVAEDDGLVVGYCGVWIIIDEAHITNIAVLPEYRGMKIGEALLKNTMMVARALKAGSMTLEVRLSNDTAKNLYRKMGFKEGGIRKKYYTDNLEDAQVMWVKL